MKLPESRSSLMLLAIIVPLLAVAPAIAASPSAAPTAVPTPIGHFDFPVRGLYVSFEERGASDGYWDGDMLQRFNDFDPVVNSTVSQEVALQLDKMAAMGVNTIAYELRSTLPTNDFGPYVPPTCPMPLILGLTYPQPAASDLANLASFFDLANSKEIRVMLLLVNTHMDDLAGSQTWLGSILGAIKDKPALALVLFDGDTFIDNGACGIPAEPPLWYGPKSPQAKYVQWAIGYAHSLGIPFYELSTEAVVGAYLLYATGPSGGLWDSLVTEKRIFHALGVPPAERTYAISIYEHGKCLGAGTLPCTPKGPHAWAAATLARVRTTVGTAAHIVAPEMGDNEPVPPGWQSDFALESLVALFSKFHIEGGTFWRWANNRDSEDSDPTLALPVKIRGVSFDYNPVQKVVLDEGGFHLSRIRNRSFEQGTGNAPPYYWHITGSGAAHRHYLAGEPHEPQVRSRGLYDLRLKTGRGIDDAIEATSKLIPVTPSIQYTTSANLRFGWTGDPNPSGDPATRPQVFVAFLYFQPSGAPSAIRAEDVFPFFQENATSDFETFPFQYTPPADAAALQIQIGAARNGLPTRILLDADNLR
jgi:hypothetical protein